MKALAVILYIFIPDPDIPQDIGLVGTELARYATMEQCEAVLPQFQEKFRWPVSCHPKDEKYADQGLTSALIDHTIET